MWRRAELERSQAVKIKVTKSYKLVLAFNDRPITTTIAYSTALINYSCRAERHSKYSASTSTYKMSLHFARDMIEMRCLVKRNFRCTANEISILNLYYPHQNRTATDRQQSGDWSAPPSPLLAVPNVTVYPSTASVPTSYCSMWCGTIIASAL